MAGTYAPKLSKSRFVHGMRCTRWLYLEVHHRDLADDVSDSTQARFDMGHRVGELATQRFPGGVLVDEDYRHQEDAERSTLAAIEAGVPAIFEAAFTFDDVRIRVDVLERLDNGRFAMHEVKSTGRYDETKHLPDVAVQLHVLRGAGVDVERAYLTHLNKEYVWPGGAFDVQALFTDVGVTEAAEAYIRDIGPEIVRLMAVLSLPEPPEAPPLVNCEEPYPCAFCGYCHADDPEHPVTDLPNCRRDSRLRSELANRGIVDLLDFPDDLVSLMSPNQRLTWQATVSGERIVLPQAREELLDLEFPLHFLDFETVNPALPLFVGTRPFQTIPVQWSDHVMAEDGSLQHFEYLADSDDDPSREFAETLLAQLADTGSVLMYTTYERTQMRALAGRFPDLAPGLQAVEPRLFDLADIVKNSCFDPGFHGSYSIKYALPVLAPHLPAYESLAVSDGQAAMLAFAQLLDSGTPRESRAQIRQDLLVYCRQDTLGMVEVYRQIVDG